MIFFQQMFRQYALGLFYTCYQWLPRGIPIVTCMIRNTGWDINCFRIKQIDDIDCFKFYQNKSTLILQTNILNNFLLSMKTTAFCSYSLATRETNYLVSFIFGETDGYLWLMSFLFGDAVWHHNLVLPYGWACFALQITIVSLSLTEVLTFVHRHQTMRVWKFKQPRIRKL